MKCKECGNTNGYFMRQSVYGYITTRYKSDGSYDDENSGMYDSISYRFERKEKYCSVCSHKLTKKELEEELK